MDTRPSASTVWLLALAVALGCGSAPPSTAPEDKIRFDLGRLDEDGLQGSAGSKRALAYEFCLSDEPRLIEELSALDPSLHLQRAPGRIGCSSDEVLMLGSTHQPRHREILERLAEHEAIARIEEAFFE